MVRCRKGDLSPSTQNSFPVFLSFLILASCFKIFKVLLRKHATPIMTIDHHKGERRDEDRLFDGEEGGGDGGEAVVGEDRGGGSGEGGDLVLFCNM